MVCKHCGKEDDDILALCDDCAKLYTSIIQKVDDLFYNGYDVMISVKSKRTPLSKAVKAFRESKGLSQEQAADLCGVSRFTIINVERGKRCSKYTEATILSKINNK